MITRLKEAIIKRNNSNNSNSVDITTNEDSVAKLKRDMDREKRKQAQAEENEAKMIELEQRGLSLVYCLGSIILFISALLTIVAFFSPYWTESDFEVNNNRFSNIGLWEICLYRYRHIEIDSYKSYTGCFWLWADEIQPLRDWIMAPWFKTVQSLVTIQFVVIVVSLAFIAISFLTSLKHKFIFLFAISLSTTILAFIMFTALLIYGANGSNKEWMPRFEDNYYSWAYWSQIGASFLTLISASFFYSEAKSILSLISKLEKTDNRRESNLLADNETGIFDPVYYGTGGAGGELASLNQGGAAGLAPDQIGRVDAV